MKRKITAVLLVSIMLLSCSTAFADNGGKAKQAHQRPQLTAQEKANIDQLKALEKQLKDELHKDKVDEAKAVALKEKTLDIKAKLSAARFERMLNKPKPARPKLSEKQKKLMQEIRAASEELRTELAKDKPDKARATKLHNRLITLKKEAAMERFKTMLKNPPKHKDGKKFKSGRGHGHTPRGHDRDGILGPYGPHEEHYRID